MVLPVKVWGSQRSLKGVSTEPPTIPPGLAFLPRFANQPYKTPRSKFSLRKIKCFSLKSDIFNWDGKTSPVYHHDHQLSNQKVKSVKIKHEKKAVTVKLSSPSLSGRWLQMFLLNCGAKVRRKCPSKIPYCSPSSVKSSFDRKVLTSEKMCERKSSPSSVSTLDRFVLYILIYMRGPNHVYFLGLPSHQQVTRLQYLHLTGLRLKPLIIISLKHSFLGPYPPL